MTIHITWKPIKNHKSKKLSRVEEEDLILKFQAGDKRAGDKIIKSYFPLVVHIASKYQNLGDPDDLVAAAMKGVFIAMGKYDPSVKAAKFGTYVSYGMKQQIKKYLNREHHLIKYINTERSQYASDNLIRAEIYIRSKYGSLTDNEMEAKLLEVLGVNEDELLRARMQHRGEAYFSSKVRGPNNQNDDESDLEDFSIFLKSEEPSVEQDYIKSEMKAQLKAIVDSVMEEQDPRTRDIVTRRYMDDEPETWTTIAASHNITKQGVVASMRTKTRNIKRSLYARLCNAGIKVEDAVG